MMLKFSKSRSFVTTAKLLTVFFTQPLWLVPLVLVAGSAAAETPANSTRFAILPFQCDDASGGSAVGSLAAQTMALALVERNGYSVASMAEVTKALQSANVQPPYLATDMVSVGKLLGVDQVIRGRVAEASVAGKPKVAVVELSTRAVEVASGMVVHETRARGVARESGAAVSDEDLRAEALKDAARQCASQITTLKGLRGIVVSRPGDQTARLSAGTEAGIQPGARVSVRDGQGGEVAQGTVTEATPTDSVITIESAEASNAVKVGQEFQAVYTPGQMSSEQSTQSDSSRARKKSSYKFLMGLLLAAGLYLLLRNDNGPAATTTAVAGGAAGLTLTASPTEMAADGQSTSTITILARDSNGNPIADGETITLTTSLGLIPATVTTTSGVATADLRAGTTPGVATVTATYGTLTQTLPVTLTTTTSSPVTVTADAQAIPADGKSTATITATFRDANNNPVADGSVVTWTTTTGTLATRARAGSRQTTLQTSTTNGSTSVVLTSSTTAGTAVVTAELAGTTTKATTTVAFTTINVQVAVTPQSITADGNSTATITATVTDSTGSPVADGTVVRFATSLGTVKTPSTTSGGTATSTLRSGTEAGTARIVVEVLDSNGAVATTNDTTAVAFEAGPATLIALAPTNCGIRGLDVVGAKTSLIVSVRDRFGNPVRDGTVVHFSTNKGTVQGSATTSAGLANANFHSNGREDGNNGTAPKNGVALIRASTTTAATASTIESKIESTSGTNTVIYDETTIILSGPAVSLSIQLASNSVQVGTDTRDPGKISFTVTVLDENGNPVENNTGVSVTATSGSASAGATVDGCTASVASGTYTAPKVGAGYAGGTATLTATVGFASTSATITLLP